MTAITSRLFVALPITVIGVGIGLTIWWIADHTWRLIQTIRKATK